MVNDRFCILLMLFARISIRAGGRTGFACVIQCKTIAHSLHYPIVVVPCLTHMQPCWNQLHLDFKRCTLSDSVVVVEQNYVFLSNNLDF